MTVTVQPHILRAALHCAAARDVRTYLNAVHLRMGADGIMRVESCDGYLMFIAVGSRDAKGVPLSLILERDSLTAALRALGRKALTAAVTDVTAQSVRLADYPVTRLAATYPDSTRVMPLGTLDPAASVLVDAKLLARLCASAAELPQRRGDACAPLTLLGTHEGRVSVWSCSNSCVRACWVLALMNRAATAAGAPDVPDVRADVLGGAQ